MKRALIALVTVGFVVAAISIARANSGEDDAPKANPSEGAQRVAEQSEQVLRAQEELRKDVEEYAEGRTHTLVVTIREERPGDVWVVGKVDGKPTCVTPPKDVPTYVTAAPLRVDMELQTKVVPLEAALLKGGACQASIELFVPLLDGYLVTVSGAGHDSIGLAKVGHATAPQKVTIVV